MSGLGGIPWNTQRIGGDMAMTIPELEGAKAALELRVEELELELSLRTTEVLLRDRRIKQLEAQLNGSRQHVTEVNQDE